MLIERYSIPGDNVSVRGYAASGTALPSTRIASRIDDAVREIRSNDRVSIPVSPRYR